MSPSTLPMPSRKPLGTSANGIPEHDPTNNEASIRATNEFSLNRAMRTIRPTTATSAIRRRLELWLMAWFANPRAGVVRRAFFQMPVDPCEFVRELQELNRQLAFASNNLPSPGRLPVFDDDGLRMQRNGRTNVPGDAVEAVSDRKFVGARRLDDQMFFTVRDRFGIEEIHKLYSRVRHL